MTVVIEDRVTPRRVIDDNRDKNYRVLFAPRVRLGRQLFQFDFINIYVVIVLRNYATFRFRQNIRFNNSNGDKRGGYYYYSVKVYIILYESQSFIDIWTRSISDEFKACALCVNVI